MDEWMDELTDEYMYDQTNALNMDKLIDEYNNNDTALLKGSCCENCYSYGEIQYTTLQYKTMNR